VLLDLGRVRGSVEVWIDDELVGEMAWSPYTIDISEVLARHPSHGDLRVLVRNTIAGYMTAVSPSPGIFAGQTSAGLFGPVTISVRRTLALSAPTVRPGR
jgi:hypothetical protein